MFGIETIKNMYLKRFVRKQLNEYYEKQGLTVKQIENLSLKEIKQSIELLNSNMNTEIKDYHYTEYLKKENEMLKKMLSKEKPMEKIEDVEKLKKENKLLRAENASLEIRNKTLIETFSRREDIKELTENIKKDLTRQQLIVSKTLAVENDLKKLKETVKTRQLEKTKV